MADKSKHWVDSNNPLAKIIILSRYCVVFLTLPCHSNTGNSCQRVVWNVWAIKIRTTSFWRPCCSKTRRKDDFPSRKVGPSESHLNAAFFLFHRTSAERAPNPDWPARVRRLLTLSQSRLQHWPVPVHPPHVPAGQPAQPTDPLARSSCWYLKKKKKKKKETQSIWESLFAPEPTAGPVHRLVLSVLLDTKGEKCKDGSAGGCDRSGHELDEVSGEWRGGVGWNVEGHFTSSFTTVNTRRRFRLIKLTKSVYSNFVQVITPTLV